MATNIINARLGCPDVTVWADWAWQYDYGQILKVSGVDLPDAYEVHFSNQETGGVTITQIGNADGVTVPDELLISGADIFVWIFLHAGLDDGETVYKIVIPVKDRPQPSDEEPTPVEHSEITQTIAALNAAVEEAEEARQAIEDMTVSAETLPEGSSATVTKTVEDGVVNLDFGIPKGDTGDRGETGVTPDFSIGDVSTLPAGSYATASITGTTEAPVLNLGIPQGQRGENGAPGQTGPTGATPNLTIGTVSTLPAGSDATATITGTPENPVLSLGIPKGDTGDVSQADLATALLNKADVITDTASGSIVSIPDGMASPVLGLDVDIEPIQDLHGYENPWPAGGGKNLAKVTDNTVVKNGVTITLANDKILLNGTCTGNTWINPNQPLKLPAGTYTMSVEITNVTGSGNRGAYGINASGIGYLYVPNNGTKQTKTFTIESELNAWLDGYVYAGNVYNNSEVRFQIEAGSTATSYAPYSNICPITGRTEAKVMRTGKNLFDKAAITPDSWIVVNTTTIESATGYFVSDYIPVEVGKPIICTTRGASRSIYYDKKKNPIAYFSWSTNVLNPLYDGYIRVTDTNSNLDTLQIEVGSSASSYEPYQGQTVTIQLGQTVYGGTVDVTEGKLVIDRAFVSASTAQGKSENENGYFWYCTSTVLSIPPIKGLNAKLISDRFRAIANTAVGDADGVISYYANGILRWKERGDLDVSAYNTYLASNPFQLCYELKTPLEVTLTPQELEMFFGDNNIWSDANDVSLEYRCDTKKYILKKIAEALNA